MTNLKGLRSIRDERTARKWSQEVLAEKVGCSVRTIRAREQDNAGRGSWPGEVGPTKDGRRRFTPQRTIDLRASLIRVFRENPVRKAIVPTVAAHSLSPWQKRTAQ